MCLLGRRIFRDYHLKVRQWFQKLDRAVPLPLLKCSQLDRILATKASWVRGPVGKLTFLLKFAPLVSIKTRSDGPYWKQRKRYSFTLARRVSAVWSSGGALISEPVILSTILARGLHYQVSFDKQVIKLMYN